MPCWAEHPFQADVALLQIFNNSGSAYLKEFLTSYWATWSIHTGSWNLLVEPMAKIKIYGDWDSILLAQNCGIAYQTLSMTPVLHVLCLSTAKKLCIWRSTSSLLGHTKLITCSLDFAFKKGYVGLLFLLF